MLPLEAKINQKERNGGLVFGCTVSTSISRSVASGKTEVLSSSYYHITQFNTIVRLKGQDITTLLGTC